MSQADIDRFITDIKGNEEMLEELQKGSTGLAYVVEFAESKGYDITLDEAKAYISAQANAELSDAELDSVAAGKGHKNETSTSQVHVTIKVVNEVEVAVIAFAVAVLT